MIIIWCRSNFSFLSFSFLLFRLLWFFFNLISGLSRRFNGLRCWRYVCLIRWWQLRRQRLFGWIVFQIFCFAFFCSLDCLVWLNSFNALIRWITFLLLCCIFIGNNFFCIRNKRRFIIFFYLMWLLFVCFNLVWLLLFFAFFNLSLLFRRVLNFWISCHRLLLFDWSIFSSRYSIRFSILWFWFLSLFVCSQSLFSIHWSRFMSFLACSLSLFSNLWLRFKRLFVIRKSLFSIVLRLWF